MNYIALSFFLAVTYPLSSTAQVVEETPVAFGKGSYSKLGQPSKKNVDTSKKENDKQEKKDELSPSSQGPSIREMDIPNLIPKRPERIRPD